jgi:hypothetical protein
MAKFTPHSVDGGGWFFNIDRRVGGGKPGLVEDILLVQAYLAIIYNENASFRKRRGSPSVLVPGTGTAMLATTIELITDFQSVIFKKRKPAGYVDPATRFDWLLKGTTIFQLWVYAEATVKPSGVNFLIRLGDSHPDLKKIVLSVIRALTPAP